MSRIPYHNPTLLLLWQPLPRIIRLWILELEPRQDYVNYRFLKNFELASLSSVVPRSYSTQKKKYISSVPSLALRDQRNGCLSWSTKKLGVLPGHWTTIYISKKCRVPWQSVIAILSYQSFRIAQHPEKWRTPSVARGINFHSEGPTDITNVHDQRSNYFPIEVEPCGNKQDKCGICLFFSGDLPSFGVCPDVSHADLMVGYYNYIQSGGAGYKM